MVEVVYYVGVWYDYVVFVGIWGCVVGDVVVED